MGWQNGAPHWQPCHVAVNTPGMRHKETISLICHNHETDRFSQDKYTPARKQAPISLPTTNAISVLVRTSAPAADPTLGLPSGYSAVRS